MNTNNNPRAGKKARREKSKSDVHLEETQDAAKLRRKIATSRNQMFRAAFELDQLEAGPELASPGNDTPAQLLIRELLPVADELESVLDRKEADPMRMLDAIEGALEKLRSLLAGHGVVMDNDVGQPYTPSLHRLAGLGSDLTQLENSVLKVIERGYRWKNQILRPASVIVNVRNRA